MSYLSRAFERDVNDVELTFAKFSHKQGKFNVFNVNLARGEKRFRTQIMRPANMSKHYLDKASVLGPILFTCSKSLSAKFADGKLAREFVEEFMGWDQKTQNQRFGVLRSLNTAKLRSMITTPATA